MEVLENNKLLVEEKQIVTPGDVLARGLGFIPGSGCYRSGAEIKSKLLGIARVKDKIIVIIPLAGVYVPKSGDGIIAMVTDLQSAFWITDINSPYDAILPLSEATPERLERGTDISVFFDVGDVVYCKVLSVSKSKNTTLTMDDIRAKKLIGGRLMTITPYKVSRLIGKDGSMIELIKKYTGCQITAGQNGVVWLRGTNESLAAKVILMIEKEAHKEGLTDRVTSLLQSEGKIENIKNESTEDDEVGERNE